jgi:mannose-6-phosphate isomerase
MWLLVLSGAARVGSLDVATGDAIFVQSDRVDIHPGTIGMVGLAAYTGGGPVPHLLQRVRQPVAMDAGRPQDVQVPTSLTQAKGGPHDGRLEITQ